MKIIAVFTLMLCVVLAQAATAAPATEKSIWELMSITGAGDIGKQMFNNLLLSLKRMHPNAPPDFWEDFLKGVKPEELENLVIPIYRQNLIEEDIRAAIGFYKTPAGQRLIEKLPAIAQRSVQAGQQGGLQLLQRAADQLKALPPANPPVQ